MAYLGFSFDTRGASGGPRIPKGQPGAGRYTSAQAAFLQRNREIAQDVQAQVVANIQERILRPAASTNRLLKVTAAPENLLVTKERLGVGMTSYLDNSVSKYWRTVEEGSERVWRHPFVGTQLYPVTTDTKLRTFVGDEPRPWMDGSRYVVKHEIPAMNAYRDAAPQMSSRSAANVREYLEEIRGLPIVNLNVRS